jgi:hypothetical protein
MRRKLKDKSQGLSERKANEIFPPKQCKKAVVFGDIIARFSKKCDSGGRGQEAVARSLTIFQDLNTPLRRYVSPFSTSLQPLLAKLEK